MRTLLNITADGLRSYINSHKEQDYELIDVRQEKEYAAGHIAGAKLIPLGELSARIIELSTVRDIIFY